MLKKIAIGLVVLIVIVTGGGYYLFLNLDHLIKSAVEKYASAATQTKVGLDSVKLILSSGDGTLSGLSVGNPKGFSSAKALYLGSINVKLDTGTIRGNGPIVIRDVVIEKPQVTYELLNDGSSNLQAIQNNTRAYAAAIQQGANPPPANLGGAPKATAAGGPEGRKIIINNLTIRSGQIAISQELLKGRQLSANLPELHLTDIGKNSGGATAAQVAQQVFGALINAAAQSSVTELAKEKIGGLIKAVPASAIGGAAADTIGSKMKSVFGQ